MSSLVNTTLPTYGVAHNVLGDINSGDGHEPKFLMNQASSCFANQMFMPIPQSPTKLSEIFEAGGKWWGEIIKTVCIHSRTLGLVRWRG